MTTQHDRGEGPLPEPRHEPPLVDVGKLATAAGALLVVLVICAAVSYAMMRAYRAPAYPRVQIDAPQPTLTPNLRQVREDHERRARAALDSLGWQDREAGIAHVPIDRAMRLLLERAAAPAPSTEGANR